MQSEGCVVMHFKQEYRFDLMWTLGGQSIETVQ